MKWLLRLLPIVFLIAAIWILRSELENFSIDDLLKLFSQIRSKEWAVLITLLVANFVSLSFYDLIAFRILRLKLGFSVLLKSAIVVFSMQNLVGQSLLSGPSLRYLCYSPFGHSLSRILAITVYGSITFWTGVLGSLGILVLCGYGPRLLPQELAWLLVGSVLLYLFLSWKLKDRFFQIRSWRLRLPHVSDAFLQFLVGAFEQLLCGSILFYLLSIQGIDLNFFEFFAVYLAAFALGIASQVPSGLGVFEWLFLSQFQELNSGNALFAALLAYRVIYFIVPAPFGLLLMFYTKSKLVKGSQS